MNKEKFKQLSFFEKVQWLIQYYGVAIVVAVIAIIVAIFFLKSVIFPEKIPDAVVLIFSDDITPGEGLEYEQELSELTGEEVDVVSYMTTDVYSEASFAAKIGVDQIDLVLAPQNEMNVLKDGGRIADYTQIPGRELYMAVPVTARINEHSQEISDYLWTKLIRE